MRCRLSVGTRNPRPLPDSLCDLGKRHIRSQQRNPFSFCRRCLSCVSEYGDHLPCRCKNAMGICMGRIYRKWRCHNSAGNRFFPQTSMYSCSSQRRRSQTSASAYLWCQRKRIWTCRWNDRPALYHAGALSKIFHPKRNAADSRNLRPEKYRIYQRQLLLPDHSGRYCRLRRFKPQPSVPFLWTGAAAVPKRIPHGFSHETGMLSVGTLKSFDHRHCKFRRIW